MKYHIASLIALILLTCFMPTSNAERVYFKNGDMLEGTVTHETETSLTLSMQSAQMVFDKKDIDHIETGGIDVSQTQSHEESSPLPQTKEERNAKQNYGTDVDLSAELDSLIACFGTADAFLASVNAWQKDIEKNPDDITLHYRLGLAAFYMRNYADAITHLSIVLKSNENDPEALLFLGYAYYKQGDLKNAVPYFEKRCSLRPYDAKTRSMLAFSYYDLNATAQAITAFESLKGTSLIPEDLRLSKLETLYLRKGDKKKSTWYQEERKKLGSGTQPS